MEPLKLLTEGFRYAVESGLLGFLGILLAVIFVAVGVFLWKLLG